MENFGAREVALDLFKSYLSRRTQAVVINDNLSNEANLYGVPQGSVLGSTLFLIHI